MTNEIAGTRKHPANAVEHCKQLYGTLIFYNLVVFGIALIRGGAGESRKTNNIGREPDSHK
jgi:hypothetical protein